MMKVMMMMTTKSDIIRTAGILITRALTVIIVLVKCDPGVLLNER